MSPPRTVASAAPSVSPVPSFVESLPEHIAGPWRREGGVKGPLGPPIAEPVAMIEGAWTGLAVRFQDGAMFSWDPSPGVPRQPPIAIAAREPSFAKWIALGAGRSPLGWPVAPVQESPDQQSRLLKCTRGTVIDHPAHGARAIWGGVFMQWMQLGGLASDLGYPIDDPLVGEGADAQVSLRFERGTLAWSPTRGASRA